MEFVKLNAYIQQLDALIRQERTGTADVFAQRLGVSERTLQNHIQQLRELGIEVIYDHFKKTYKYAQKGKIHFGFRGEDMSNIKGGFRFDFPSQPSI